MKRIALLITCLAIAALAFVVADRLAVVDLSAQSDGTPVFRPVTWERLLNAADEPENWLMYNGTLDAQRYSGLEQIHSRNVQNLELKWAYQIPEIDRAETTPLVVDGIMFVTEAPSNVVALDAATGRQYWRYEQELPDDLRICCGRNNRGVAILGETLYYSSLDAKLVALDARSGNQVWESVAANYQSGYSKTAAPLIVKDQVVTGIAGGEFGIRGFLDAYDADTGTLTWRTYTIPGPDEPGNDTWAGDSWRTGGSPTWITGAYDADLDLVYWGTGNPGPDWNGEVRLGDNLYSDSALALNGESGELEWYFQFTPHDIHDWDAIQVPILGDIMYEGEMRKVMMWANRNAFYYTLDRETGEFLVGTEYAKQTWAEGLDENGRPIRAAPQDTYHSAVRAIDPATGDVRWEYPIAPRSTSGLTSTAGDLVFGGTVDGYFFAIDAVSGEELWHVAVGARVHAAPITYAVDGEQYVTIAAGNVVFTFGLSD